MTAKGSVNLVDQWLVYHFREPGSSASTSFRTSTAQVDRQQWPLSSSVSWQTTTSREQRWPWSLKTTLSLVRPDLYNHLDPFIKCFSKSSSLRIINWFYRLFPFDWVVNHSLLRHFAYLFIYCSNWFRGGAPKRGSRGWNPGQGRQLVR